MKKQELIFIAGFNAETFKGDKNKLAKVVGIHLIILGLLILILPLGLLFVGDIAGKVIALFMIASMIILIFSMNRLSEVES